FFQAEDGIRDRNVTGVQTCALPIYRVDKALLVVLGHGHGRGAEVLLGQLEDLFPDAGLVARVDLVGELLDQLGVDLHLGRRECRSEERRVGRECRSRWSTYGQSEKL